LADLRPAAALTPGAEANSPTTPRSPNFHEQEQGKSAKLNQSIGLQRTERQADPSLARWTGDQVQHDKERREGCDGVPDWWVIVWPGSQR
jgi:hypothetical protein